MLFSVNLWEKIEKKKTITKKEIFPEVEFQNFYKISKPSKLRFFNFYISDITLFGHF